MPYGLARYKNNKYFKTEKGAFGGRVRLLSKKDSIPYESFKYNFSNKVKKQVLMINELRITVNNDNKILRDNSNNIKTQLTINNKLQKSSINFNNSELRINTSDDKTLFLKRNYTEFKPILTKHINKYKPIQPNELLVRTSDLKNKISLYKDLSDDITSVNKNQQPILSIENKPALTINIEDTNLLTYDVIQEDKFINLTPTNRWTAGQGTIDGFVQNGSTVENTRELGIGPFGIEEMLWVCKNNDTASDPDGGWEKYIPNINSAKDYVSIVFFKYKSTGPTGNFYHGCLANTTTAVIAGVQANTARTNPYFNHPQFQMLSPNKWYVSIGFIHGFHRVTDFIDKGGIYDLETKQRVFAASAYRFDVGATAAMQRVYKYFDTTANTEMCFASPIFTEYDGTENTITLDQILSCNYEAIYKKLSIKNNTDLINKVGLYNYKTINRKLFLFNKDSKIVIDKTNNKTIINDSSGDKSLTFNLLKPLANLTQDIKPLLKTNLGENRIKLSFNRNEQVRVNKKFVGASIRTFNQVKYNDSYIKLTRKYSGENKVIRRGLLIEEFRENENLNKDIFVKQYNTTRRTEENVRINRRGMLADIDDIPYYEKGELIGLQREYIELPVYNENKFEQEVLQITVPHTQPALAMTFEFVSPTISAVSEAESVPASSSDSLNRVVIEAQKKNYIRFNVQLNNTLINDVTNLPAGFSFDKLGIFGSSPVAGTFTGEIKLVNGNSFPYLLKIHNIKRLQ